MQFKINIQTFIIRKVISIYKVIAMKQSDQLCTSLVAFYIGKTVYLFITKSRSQEKIITSVSSVSGAVPNAVIHMVSNCFINFEPWLNLSTSNIHNNTKQQRQKRKGSQRPCVCRRARTILIGPTQTPGDGLINYSYPPFQSGRGYSLKYQILRQNV